MYSLSSADNYQTQSMYSITSNNYHSHNNHNHHHPQHHLQQPMYFGIELANKMADTPGVPPLRNSPDDLFQSFIEVQEKYLHNQQQAQQQRRKMQDDDEHDDIEIEDNVFEMAREFEDLTGAHLQVLVNLRDRQSLTEDDASICKKLEVMLKEEKNTWRLAKALFKDQMLNESQNLSHNSDRMDDSGNLQNGQLDDNHVVLMQPGFSEEKMINRYFSRNSEIRRMQLVADWLEANAKEEDNNGEFFSEGPTSWENTFHAMRAKYNIDIPGLDISLNPQSGVGVEICSAMDPDAPFRTKKSLVHADKEIEIKLFKHLFRFIRAGDLSKGQDLAQRFGYHWLSATLDGWITYEDENLDDENSGTIAIYQPSELKPISGNKKRDIWKQTCFRSAKMHGLTSSEKAILGVLGGNLKSVLPVCLNWSDQLWARLKCSIDVKIEKMLRDPNIVPQENRHHLTDYPQEFYDNYQDFESIFKSMKELKIVSPFKEATIHQTVQKHLILNDIDGILDQLDDWCKTLDYDNNLADNKEAVSPQFLRFFAHIVLFLREINLISASDIRGTRIIEYYIGLLTQQKSIESVAHYTVFLPKENQIVSYAKLLATINDKEERKHCLKIAKESKLDVDEITQTVVELIRDEPSSSLSSSSMNHSNSMSEIESTKTTATDKRKIEALDYLLFLDSRNYVAILHHGNVLMRLFALQRKIDALKETFSKLPSDLSNRVKDQWRLHTNGEITPSLNNNLRELDGFRVLLEAQMELSQWSEWHHKKPEEPKKPANLSKFCDNVNYEQRLKQYQQDLSLWKGLREVRTDSLTGKIMEMFYFPDGWMTDLKPSLSRGNLEDDNDGHDQGERATNRADERSEQLRKLRKIFVPQMTTICFNVLHLTNRFEDCLKVSHLLAQEDLKLYEEFTKAQMRDFLDKISEVTKIIVRKSITEG